MSEFCEKSSLKNVFGFKDGVKSIQTVGYNSAHRVKFRLSDKQTKFDKNLPHGLYI
jgi:hypothetical protein